MDSDIKSEFQIILKNGHKYIILDTSKYYDYATSTISMHLIRAPIIR